MLWSRVISNFFFFKNTEICFAPLTWYFQRWNLKEYLHFLDWISGVSICLSHLPTAVFKNHYNNFGFCFLSPIPLNHVVMFCLILSLFCVQFHTWIFQYLQILHLPNLWTGVICAQSDWSKLKVLQSACQTRLNN